MGHKPVHLGTVIMGVRKKEGVIQVPDQPNVEVIYGDMIQCQICKAVGLIEKQVGRQKEDTPIIVEAKS